MKLPATVLSAAIFAVATTPQWSHAQSLGQGLRLAQAQPNDREKNEKQTPPGQKPAPGQKPPGNQRPEPPAAQHPGPPATQRPAQATQPAAPPAAQRPGQPPQRPAAAAPSPAQPGAPRPAQPAAAQPGAPQPPAAQAPAAQAPAQQQRPAGAAAIANAPVNSAAGAHHLDQLRGERHETRQGNAIVIQEADRTIIREGGHDIIRHNEAARFQVNARDVEVEHRGNDTVTIALRPDGSRIITEVDATGRLLRRVRRDPQGHEIVIIDNTFEPRGPGFAGFVVDLPPPVVRIPRELYIRELDRASAEDVYLTLVAPPVDRIERRYALDEIRYSEALRLRMPRVDIDTVNFDSGSWEIAPDQIERLAFVAQGIQRAVRRNPREVFMIEGYTDAVGNDVDNLSLSDRRAESVALALTDHFGIPPENLTTQGYGKQFLKVPTEGPERANRRVAVRRITPLLLGQN